MQEARNHSGIPTAFGRLAVYVCAAAALTLFAASAAHAQRSSGIQLTPDSGLYLISKDVGPDRWAITYDLANKTVSGNVFPQGGGTPQFVWCETASVQQAANPADALYNLQCFVAQPCASAPCTPEAWNLGSPLDVQVPGSFLLPTNTRATYAGNVQPIYTTTCATSASCHVAGGAGPVDLREGVSYAATFEVLSTEDPSKFYINPFSSDLSFLFNKVDGSATPRMPLGGPFLDPATEDEIRQWILEGAANN